MAIGDLSVKKKNSTRSFSQDVEGNAAGSASPDGYGRHETSAEEKDIVAQLTKLGQKQQVAATSKTRFQTTIDGATLNPLSEQLKIQ